ncbi:MAG TPA: hypothetical protein VHB79_01325 [Polyangiaceae bacterium]|nr:hypothetical protein [Polyangiaceae bacterium]
MFIPTHCDGCSKTALVAELSITGGMAQCAECGGTMRVLPGESYSEDDIPLFNDLCAALDEVGLSQKHAAGLAAQLEIRRTQPPGHGLRQLAQVLPSLGILELIVANRATTLRKAESMLATLLGVVVAGRRPQSGLLSRPSGISTKDDETNTDERSQTG